MSAQVFSDNEVTQDLFPAVCEGCEMTLWTKDHWAGHHTAEYCDSNAIIPGLPGGIQP